MKGPLHNAILFYCYQYTFPNQRCVREFYKRQSGVRWLHKDLWPFLWRPMTNPTWVQVYSVPEDIQ